MIYVPISVRVTDTEKVTKYSTKNQRDGLHLMEKDSPFIIIYEGYTIYNNFSWKLSYFITLILLSIITLGSWLCYRKYLCIIEGASDAMALRNGKND